MAPTQIDRPTKRAQDSSISKIHICQSNSLGHSDCKVLNIIKIRDRKYTEKPFCTENKPLTEMLKPQVFIIYMQKKSRHV